MKQIWKKAYLFSIIAMVLCISMLVGASSALFNDTGFSDNNKVAGGLLTTQLLKYDGKEYVDISGGKGDIFNDANGLNWEPGRTEVVFLAAKNVGDLALDCTLVMEATFGEASMNNALEYAILPNIDKAAYDAMGIKDWQEFRRHQTAQYGQVVSGQCFVTDEYMLLTGEMQYFALAVHMKENSDSSYYGGSAVINIKIASTQAPYETGAEGSDYDENPYPIKEWEGMMPTITFESTILEPMTEKEGKPVVVYDESRFESKYVLRLLPGERAQYSNNATPQPAGGEFKITGWFKTDNPNTVVTITYWRKLADGMNEAVSVELKDEYLIIAPSEGWKYFEVPVVQEANAYLAQFILNNNVSITENAGNVYFDDLRYMRVLDENAYAAQEWAEQLQEEASESMMIQNGIDDPFNDWEPISENLVINGDFSAETGILLEKNQELMGTTTGWKSNIYGDANRYVEITPEGTLRATYVPGSNDTKIHRRIDGGLTQTVENIIPGGTYMVKFRYKIDEKSKNPTATWYGPYCYFSSYGPKLPGIDEEQTIDYTLLRADGHPEGLKIDGEWHTFSQLVQTSGQAESMGIGIYLWLYEGDSYEVDDVEVYLVDYGPQINLDVETKFFYTDMGTTSFTADIKEDVYPDLAADKNATAKFEVFNGKDLIWESDEQKFTGEGCTASVDFDLSLMTELAVPYVVRCTLTGGDGTKLYEITDKIYIYDRPTSLDNDGNFIKLTPNGEHLDFNMAYAIVQGDYEKTLEIGCNVMSLSESQNAEQVLERLDYCLKYGYMGFLNMNWGLYNENDIALKRWVVIDVVSDERIRNHPALLGYCLVDEPWSWGAEATVRDNLEEGYRLIRQYDKENVIFSVNNMVQFHEKHAMYCDVMFVDHYDKPEGGTIYDKALKAKLATGGRMPLWTVISTYKEGGYFPTGDQARNTIWQAFLAGSNGLGYYAITYSDFADDGSTISIWDVTDDNGNKIGLDLWDSLKSFKEKEWDIAFDHFGDGEGSAFSEKIAINDGYMYTSWVDKYGNFYLVVLNVAGEKSINVQIPLVSDNGKVSVGGFTATVINGSDQGDFTGNGTVNVTLQGNEAVLYLIKPDGAVDFSQLD